MITFEECQNLDDVLAHYGKKGMKWGVRNAEKRMSKPTNDQILDARTRLASAQRQINNQADKVNTSSGKKQTQEAAKYAKMKADFLKNPDQVTARYMTRGDKAAHALLAVAFPAVGTGIAAVSVGANRVVRKDFEKMQAQSKKS